MNSVSHERFQLPRFFAFIAENLRRRRSFFGRLSGDAARGLDTYRRLTAGHMDGRCQSPHAMNLARPSRGHVNHSA